MAGSWTFEGEPLNGPITKKFKLIRLGSVDNNDQAERRAGVLGLKLARGEWRDAFKAKFPQPERKIYVAFGSDQSRWLSPPPFGRRFPVLYEDKGNWVSDFACANDYRSSDSLWLVEDK